jgi:hypothetical protein
VGLVRRLLLHVTVEELFYNAVPTLESRGLCRSCIAVESLDSGLQIARKLGRELRAAGHVRVLAHAFIDRLRKFCKRRPLDYVTVIGAGWHYQSAVSALAECCWER